MKLRIVTMFLSVAAVSAWGVACGVQQAKPECLVGRGLFAAKYTLKDPSQASLGACGQKSGEVLGVNKYVDAAYIQNDKPDYNHSILSIKPDTLLQLAPPPSGGQPQSDIIVSATFPGDPDASGWCTANQFPQLSYTDTAGGTGTYGYQFKNVKFFAAAVIPGTQFVADLDYTEGGCTATYSVSAVFPAVSCATDADCGQLDINTGLGLNPNFPVHCDLTIPDGYGDVGRGLCVLSKTVPACTAPADNPQACAGAQ